MATYLYIVDQAVPAGRTYTPARDVALSNGDTISVPYVPHVADITPTFQISGENPTFKITGDFLDTFAPTQYPNGSWLPGGCCVFVGSTAVPISNQSGRAVEYTGVKVAWSSWRLNEAGSGTIGYFSLPAAYRSLAAGSTIKIKVFNQSYGNFYDDQNIVATQGDAEFTIPVVASASAQYSQCSDVSLAPTYYEEGRIRWIQAQDCGAGEGTRPSSWDNSTAAETAFIALLPAGTTTYGFEDKADDLPAPFTAQWSTTAIPNFTTGTLTGDGFVNAIPFGTNGSGRYPTAGNNYYDFRAACTWTFGSFASSVIGIGAFGLYAVDIGDEASSVNSLAFTFTFLDGTTQTITPTYNRGNSNNFIRGNVQYYGFLPKKPVTAVTVENNSGGFDVMGVDAITVAPWPSRNYAVSWVDIGPKWTAEDFEVSGEECE